MFEASRGMRWLIGLIGSLCVGSLLALLVFTFHQQVDEVAEASPTSTSPGVWQTTTTIALGVPNLKATSDRLFLLRLPDGRLAEQSVPIGWRLSQLTPAPPLSLSEKSDGTTVLSGTDWNVPLRAAGKSYQDASLLGMFDASHAAVIATLEDRWLLSVSRVGDIQRLFPVTETMNPLFARDGAAWFSTFQPGEGIESPPTGPSSLIQVKINGATSTVLGDTRVIVRALPGPNGAMAVDFDSGDLRALSASSTWEGKGQALTWLDQDHLLFHQGPLIFFADLPQQVVTRLPSLPEPPTAGVVTSTSL